MPPKRRQKHGLPASPPVSFLKASASDNSLTDPTNKLITSNGFGHGDYDGITDHHPLSAKVRQQLERNTILITLNKDQLKAECRRRGQKTTGTKTELLQRLGYKMLAQQKSPSVEIGSNTPPKKSHSSSSLLQSTSNNNVNLTKSGQKAAAANSLGNSNIKSSASNGVKLQAPFVRKQSAKDRERERNERSKIVLWRHPIQTVKYCGLEVVALVQTSVKKVLEHKKTLAAFLMLLSILTAVYHVPGKHQMVIDVIRANIWFVTYWVGLGVLSSVGLGTGLHTFLLYLGPHIASVTLAAYECNSLDFPKPPYPDDIICPEKIDPSFIPSLWNIMTKVRFEAFLWGAGTALGELPPYFMARAARLSGYDPEDDEEMQEFEELQRKKEQGAELNILDRAKLSMEKVVERVGFLGILACASIPNPLFDLAGITCGHFLVPFWTFFGATLIGKAVIKMHIQKVFVIIAFNELLIERAVDILGSIPIIGKRAQAPFKTFLKNQKTKLHRGTAQPGPAKSNIIASFFEKVVIAMVVYFIVSIINSLAQNYHKRIHKKAGKVLRKVAKD